METAIEGKSSRPSGGCQYNINGRLHAALTPPPSGPLPPIPIQRSDLALIGLIPKRALSHIPTTLINSKEERHAHEVKAPREHLIRAYDIAHQRTLDQAEQNEYPPSHETYEDRGPLSTSDSRLSKHTSPFDLEKTRTLNDLPPKPAVYSQHRTCAATSLLSSNSSLERPLLCNANVRREAASSDEVCVILPRKPFIRSPSGSWLYGRSQGREQGQGAAGPQSWVALQEASSTDDHEFTQKTRISKGLLVDHEFQKSEPGITQQPLIDDRNGSISAPTTFEEAESSWADDNSVLDLDERKCAGFETDEGSEVKALRRQVEQLQMALQKQCSPERLVDWSQISPSSSAYDRYPFGTPTPNTSRDGSSVCGIADAFKAPISTGRISREQHLPLTQLENEQSSSPVCSSGHSYNAASRGGPRRRLSSEACFISEVTDRHRYIPDAMSSIIVDESASAATGHLEDSRLEELSRRIIALESVCKMSRLSSQFDSVVSSSSTRLQQHCGDERKSRMVRSRRASLATISTIDREDAISECQSPAASAFNFNATGSYECGDQNGDGTTVRPAHVGTISNNNVASIDVDGRKKVARFIMGVGQSKGNLPRDEFGNPLPSMQVSWSRKRNEKIARPVSNAKMKVGPGRGRIILHPKP